MNNFIKYLLISKVAQMADMAILADGPFRYCDIILSGIDEAELKKELTDMAYKKMFYQSRYYLEYRYLLYIAIQKLVDMGVLPKSCWYRKFLSNSIERPAFYDYYRIEGTDDDETDGKDFTESDIFIDNLLADAGLGYHRYDYSEEEAEEMAEEELVEEFFHTYPQLKSEAMKDVLLKAGVFSCWEGCDILLFFNEESPHSQDMLLSIVNCLFPMGEIIVMKNHGVLYWISKEGWSAEGIEYPLSGHWFCLYAILRAKEILLYDSIFKKRLEDKQSQHNTGSLKEPFKTL